MWPAISSKPPATWACRWSEWACSTSKAIFARLRLLTNPQRPVQLILAGKAHPADVAGQALIQKWIQFIRQPAVRPHAIFLSDYDMLLTEHLVQG